MLCQSSPSTTIVSGKDTAKSKWSASGHLHTRNTESSFILLPTHVPAAHSNIITNTVSTNR